MNNDDQIAAAERARDEDTERAHGGDGVEVIERYTDAEWLDCMADLILPDTEKEAKQIKEELRNAMFWAEAQVYRSRIDCAFLSMSAVNKIGRIIVANAIKNGITMEQISDE